MAINNAVNVGLLGSTGGGAFVGSLAPVINSPTISDSTFGLNILTFTGVASAVNYIQLTNATSTNPPLISAIGTATNIYLSLVSKGTGGINLKGSTDGTNAAAGQVAELMSSIVVAGSAVPLTTGAGKTVTSLSLTPGDWDVWGNIQFAITGTCTNVAAGLNTVTNTLPGAQLYSLLTLTSILGAGLAAPMQPITVSSATTVFLVAEAGFTTGTASAYGALYARRRH